MKYEESFGVIPVKKKDTEWEVFLIQHMKGRYWGFPKGHAEEGETQIEAAFRELKEETNLDPVNCMSMNPFVEHYQFIARGRRVSKRVCYYLAEVKGDVVLQPEEIYSGTWVSLEEGIEKITHKEGKAILKNVSEILQKI